MFISFKIIVNCYHRNVNRKTNCLPFNKDWTGILEYLIPCCWSSTRSILKDPTTGFKLSSRWGTWVPFRSEKVISMLFVTGAGVGFLSLYILCGVGISWGLVDAWRVRGRVWDLLATGMGPEMETVSYIQLNLFSYFYFYFITFFLSLLFHLYIFFIILNL